MLGLTLNGTKAFIMWVWIMRFNLQSSIFLLRKVYQENFLQDREFFTKLSAGAS